MALAATQRLLQTAVARPWAWRAFCTPNRVTVQHVTGKAAAGADPLGAPAAGEASDSDDEDMVPMVDPHTGEWGGPTKGGTMPEPTRFGDWERAGRCTDFS